MLKLPTFPPIDKVTARDRRTTSASLLATDVSDDHSVCSQTLSPTPAEPDCPPSPSPAPYTVILNDPVAAPLLRRVLLTAALTTDTASLTDPTRIPALTSPARLDLETRAPRQSIFVSDTHCVDSHPVHPKATTPQNVESSIPPPSTVTLNDPVAAAFLTQIELRATTAVDIPSVKLPLTAPTVSDSRCDDRAMLLA